MLNFKIKKRANQPESEEVHEVGKHQAQILAVWGSPGCGKTTVSVKIAKHLAEKKKNVILVLSDMTLPMMPCICPMDELENIWSLGNVLAAPHVTKGLIEENSYIRFLFLLFFSIGWSTY